MNDVSSSAATDSRNVDSGDRTGSARISDPGLTALALIARMHGIATDEAQMRHRSGLGEIRFSERELLRAAKALGLKARIVAIDPQRLSQMTLPALLFDSNERHFVLAKLSEERALIQDGDCSAPQIMTLTQLNGRSNGHALLVASRASLVGELARFDFSWFIPAVVKYRRLLLEVLGISFLIQTFGLVPPLMFQVIMDKVLTNRAYDTLSVVAVAMLLAAVFETLLTGLRNYIFAHTTNRMDVELGARLFRHLVQLPLAYFAARRVGDSVSRVRELENIRNFLTGQALTASLDVVFSVIFIAVMALYSVKLTLIVVLSLVFYVAISAAINPAFRKALDVKFARGADNNSFLVETVSGCETVKAHAVEPQFARKWDTLLAAYVTAGFRVTTLANLGQQLIQLVGKLVTLAILFLGAYQVINGKMTIGQLVAFNMLAGRVSGPLVQLVTMVHEYQEVALSVKMLGEVMNQKPERDGNREGLMPEFAGRVEFENVSFRYGAEGAPALDDVSFSIDPGTIFGIVGRSGSGKTTLTRLISGMYPVQQGLLRIDGYDCRELDLVHLRRNLGIVLQDNFLFRGTVRENIACVKRDATFAEVVQAAQIAGADEFIERLPRGFDTMLEENGSNLSGGQKQRLAIARALIVNPRILILDEATSSLDSESEMIIRRNLRRMAEGRTVIIVSHRLSMLSDANQILVIDRGRIVDVDRHDRLLSKCTIYRHLWNQQTKQIA